ncbi:hypothetical protein WBQ88_16880 [Sphingopyxis sp. CCNWLW253]|uniref:hypothetical protein n=1 Tax=unclassified Sphingopyxis TaxID=2614943 RepID=UPI003012A329
MHDFANWLRSNESLSGWAQFLGAMIALIVTYRLASLPHRYRDRQLEASASRLLLNGYEALESFHRTSAHFLPRAINLRAAGLSMIEVASEIDRFPLFELRDQGPQSVARNLVAVAMLLKLTNLVLEDQAEMLGLESASEQDRDQIRGIVENQMNLVRDIIQGKPLKRPDFSFAANG